MFLSLPSGAARVRVITGKHAQMDEVHSGASVMSQGDLRLHFGLGKVETVDLIENIERARDDDVLAIPTLVRRLPAPVRKIIGDLSNTNRVLAGLRLLPDGAA